MKVLVAGSICANISHRELQIRVPMRQPRSGCRCWGASLKLTMVMTVPGLDLLFHSRRASQFESLCIGSCSCTLFDAKATYTAHGLCFGACRTRPPPICRPEVYRTPENHTTKCIGPERAFVGCILEQIRAAELRCSVRLWRMERCTVCVPSFGHRSRAST